MNMRKKLAVLTLTAVAVAVTAAPSFAARSIQGSVGEVSGSDGAALGTVGFRIWSAMSGGETNFNDNVASCRNLRCLRTYITNTNLAPGGYVGNSEATQVYNGDAVDQPFYELVDASMNDGAGNHIGYFGVSGVTTDNSGVGEFLKAGCPGVQALNCFGRIDADDAGAVLSNTNAAFGAGAHQIRPIGGLNPIPTVNVNVVGTTANLSWLNAPGYGGNMRPSTGSGAPASPVKGVRLYKNFTPDCSEPTAADPGWTPIGSFDNGNNATSDAVPAAGSGCNFYALTVRLVGPGGDANEIETFRVGAHSQGVGSTPTAIRIVRFSANYAGHGVVNINWQSGIEGDLQGFYVTRSVSANGPFTRVSDLVRALGDNHVYAATDRAPQSTRTYYYQLQVLGRDGSVSTTTPAAVTLPARGRKGGPGIK